jgi:hypothetical protein
MLYHDPMRGCPIPTPVLCLLAVLLAVASLAARAQTDTDSGLGRGAVKQPQSRLAPPSNPLTDPSSIRSLHQSGDDFDLPRPNLRPDDMGDNRSPLSNLDASLSDLPKKPKPPGAGTWSDPIK